MRPRVGGRGGGHRWLVKRLARGKIAGERGKVGRKTRSSDRLVLMLVVRGERGRERVEPLDSEADCKQLCERSVILISVKQRPRAMNHGNQTGSRAESAAGERARGAKTVQGTSGRGGVGSKCRVLARKKGIGTHLGLGGRGS